MPTGPSSDGVCLATRRSVTRRAVHSPVNALARSSTLSYILSSRQTPRRRPCRVQRASLSCGSQKKREVQAQLPPSGREKVCPACKTAAELRSRTVRHPPTRVSASVGGVSVPPAATAVMQQGDLPRIAVAADASSVEGLMHAHLRRTRPDKITTVFSNGRTRTYVRIPTPVESVVGPRHGRRRRAMAAGAVTRITQADPSAAAAAIATIQSQAKSRGGLAVAPWSSLFVREQLQFKVSNRISGVTWGRFRALVAAGGKS